MRGLYLHRRFFIFLWMGVLGSVLAFIFPVLYVWMVMLVGIGGILVATDIFLLYLFGDALEALRRTNEKFSNGEENPVCIRVVNRYPFAVRARVMDEIPVGFQKRDLLLYYRLPAGEHEEQTYFLRPVKRGVYKFGQIRIFVTSRLSFIERRYSFAGEQEMAVYPSFVAMHKYELMALSGAQAGNGFKKMRLAGMTTFFDQIKPYVQGDDPRTVNWKATAKCDRLMTNTYTEERSQPVYCLVDKGRTMQAPFKGMTTLDYAINATLGLTNVILKKGDRAGLLTFGDKPGTLIRADNRRMQLNRINESLYGQQTGFLESDFEQLCVTASRQLHTRSLLILFTNFDTVTGMKRCLPVLKRLANDHLLLVILFENTEINQVVTEPAGSLRDIYFKALAGDFITAKKQMARELKKAGILTILTKPEELTVKAINAYLELKGRGLI